MERIRRDASAVLLRDWTANCLGHDPDGHPEPVTEDSVLNQSCR